MTVQRRVTSKTRIWDAAVQLFPERGYAATSVRDIAAAAGVDPALIIRHFGSKEQLFLQSMQVDLSLNPLMSGPIDTLGERFIDFIVTTDEQVRGIYLALMRASASNEVGVQLREVHETAFVAPILARLTGPDTELRARLAAALVGGLLYSLWVVGDETLAAADHQDIVRRYGALLQALITPS